MIGVVDAKSQGHTLAGVESQPMKYPDARPASSSTTCPYASASRAPGPSPHYTDLLKSDIRKRELALSALRHGL